MTEFSKKAMEEWRRGKNAKTLPRVELTEAETLQFIKLCSENASSAAFEIAFGMNRRDIDRTKSKLGIDSIDKARQIYLSKKSEMEDEDPAVDEARARRSEQEAQQRLEESQRQRTAEANEKASQRVEKAKELAPKLKLDDAERQKRHIKSTSKEVSTKWSLPIDGDREEAIKRFQNDIVYRGMRFTREKYGITNNDIMSEAGKFNLKINWDLVRP